MPRGGNEESRNESINIIKERQELVERTGQFQPVTIFAEAGTTNGTHIIKFKKGSFFAEKRIKPMYLKFDKDATISIAFDCVEQLPLVLL